MKDLTEQVNGQVPTANEEGENQALKTAQNDMMPAVNPMEAKAQGLGPDAAKMAGTPNGRKGVLNAQQERASLSSTQSDQAVNPQGQSVDDYYRQQDIQQQTLGQAQENAKAFEEQMKQAGSSSGQVGKYIVESTQRKLDNLENESYTEELFKGTDIQSKLVDDLELDASLLEDPEVASAIGDFTKQLSQGAKPEDLDLVALQEALGVDDVKFTKITKSIKDAVDSINLGAKLAEDIIDAEEVTIQVLMDEGFVSESDVRDSLGLFNGEPLPDNWQEMSYAEIQGIANQQFQDKASELDQMAVMEGANFDAGSAYDRAADKAEASEEMGQTVQFGDQLMTMDKFLDNDRIKREINTFGRDFDFDLEGEQLSSELERLFGSKYETNPEHYEQLFRVAKENQGIIDKIDTSIVDADTAVTEVTDMMKGITNSEGVLQDMFGVNLNTWDLNASELESIKDVMGKHSHKFTDLKESDPEFWATLKKDPDQSWEDYAQELNDKMAGVDQYDDTQKVDKYYDENGNLKRGVQVNTVLSDMYGIDQNQLSNLKALSKDFPEAAKFYNSLPKSLRDAMSDGKVTAAELKNVDLKGGMNLDDLAGKDLSSIVNGLSEGRSTSEVNRKLADHNYNSAATQKIENLNAENVEWIERNFSKLNSKHKLSYIDQYTNSDPDKALQLLSQVENSVQKTQAIEKIGAVTASAIADKKGFDAKSLSQIKKLAKLDPKVAQSMVVQGMGKMGGLKGQSGYRWTQTLRSQLKSAGLTNSTLYTALGDAGDWLGKSSRNKIDIGSVIREGRVNRGQLGTSSKRKTDWRFRSSTKGY